MRKFVTFPLVGLLGLVMALGLVTAAGSQAEAAAYRMQIHEIYYNSPGPDYGGNASLNHEWVQLHNTSGSRINLANWTLRDKAGHVFVFGSSTSAALARPTVASTSPVAGLHLEHLPRDVNQPPL